MPSQVRILHPAPLSFMPLLPNQHKPLEELWRPCDAPTFILDWDSTACTKETLDYLAEHALAPDELAEFNRITDQGMGGDLAFSDSLARRFSLLRATRDQVKETGQNLVQHLDPTLVQRQQDIETMHDRVFVVSGGFKELILPSANKLGIPENNIFANSFIYDDEGYVVGADPANLTSQDDGKAKQVHALGLSGLKIIIGDGYNDYRIKALGMADIFIAYTRHALRDSVVCLADGVVDSFDAPLLT